MATCTTCNDTHKMPFGERTVMCTHCPAPCSSCARGGGVPYCAHTPCDCACHRRTSMRIGGPSLPELAPEDVDAMIADGKRVDRKIDAVNRLSGFVEVMERKFIRSAANPAPSGGDAFYGVNTGAPDEAECRVSDIRELLAMVKFER